MFAAVTLGAVCGLCVAAWDPTALAVVVYLIISVSGIVWGRRIGFRALIILGVYSAYSAPALVGLLIRQESVSEIPGIVFLYSTGYVALFGGLALSVRRFERNRQTTRRESFGHLLPGAILLYVLAGGYYLMILLRGYGSLTNLFLLGRSVSASGMYTAVIGNTAAYGALVLFTASIVVLFCELYAKRRLLAWICLVVPLGILLAIGNRSAPAFVGVSILVVFVERGWSPPRWMGYAAALCAYLVVGPVGQARLYWHNGWNAIITSFDWTWFDPSTSELAASVATTRTLLETRYSEWMFGTTYMQAMINALPSFLQPVHYERPAHWYTRTYMPAYHDGGFGAGFSPITEAYMNLGWFGPVVVLSLMGILFGFALGLSNRFGLIGAYVAATLLASFINVMRIDFGGAITQYLFVSVGLAFMVVVSKVFRSRALIARSANPLPR